MVSPRKLLPGHRGTGCMETGSATAERAGPASQRKPLWAPLCRTAPVPGVWQCICPHDPVLNGKPWGVCLQGLPPERKNYCGSHRIHEETWGCYGSGVLLTAVPGQRRVKRVGETCEIRKCGR